MEKWGLECIEKEAHESKTVCFVRKPRFSWLDVIMWPTALLAVLALTFTALRYTGLLRFAVQVLMQWST